MKSEEELCKKLTKKKRYDKYNCKTLRKLLYRARSPGENDILKHLLEEPPDSIARTDLLRMLST